MVKAVTVLLAVISLCPLVTLAWTLICSRTRLAAHSLYVTAAGSGVAFVVAAALLAIVSNPTWVPEDATCLEVYPWIHIDGQPPLVMSIALGIDTFSALLLCATTLVTTVVVTHASRSGEILQPTPHSKRVSSEAKFIRHSELTDRSGSQMNHPAAAYSAGVSALLFATIMLLLSENFLQFFLFWQVLTVAGTLISGFRFDKSAAAEAARKTYFWHLIADACFVIGLLFIWFHFETFEFSDILTKSTIDKVNTLSPAVIPAICVCLVAAAVARCAQFPVFVWLKGTSQVSSSTNAVLHAVTTMPAGIYLVARCIPLFDVAPNAQVLIAFIGGLTVVLTGIVALVEDDLRQILGFTSAGQFGLMLLALSIGSFSGIFMALLVLLSHAIAKSMLFLAAGDVIFRCNGVASIKRLGAMRRLMPKAHWTFLMGAVILASGLWGQAGVLGCVWAKAIQLNPRQPQIKQPAEAAPSRLATDPQSIQTSDTGADHAILAAAEPGYANLLLLCLTASGLFLSSAAVFRAYFQVFYGENHSQIAIEPPVRKSSTIPTSRSGEFGSSYDGGTTTNQQWELPLNQSSGAQWTTSTTFVVLTLAAGLIALAATLRFESIDSILTRTFPINNGTATLNASTRVSLDSLAVAVILSAIAAILAWMVATRVPNRTHRPAVFMDSITRLGQNCFYLDDSYDRLVVRVVQGFASTCQFVERFFWEVACRGCLRWMPSYLGKFLRPLHNGVVQFYALTLVLTVGVLVFVLFLFGN